MGFISPSYAFSSKSSSRVTDMGSSFFEVPNKDRSSSSEISSILGDSFMITKSGIYLACSYSSFHCSSISFCLSFASSSSCFLSRSSLRVLLLLIINKTNCKATHIKANTIDLSSAPEYPRIFFGNSLHGEGSLGCSCYIVYFHISSMVINAYGELAAPLIFVLLSANLIPNNILRRNLIGLRILFISKILIVMYLAALKAL